jgi:hypothetical protein
VAAAGSGSADSKPVATVEPTRPKVHPPAAHPIAPTAPPPASTPEDDGDPDTREKLQQARAALDHRNYDLAEQIANAVINNAPGAKARAAAHLVHGLVQCEARNDQEAAQIDLRSLQGFGGMRSRLLNECRKRGVVP